MLPQAVTTVWRTELGTTLVFGFNSTTEVSAYFRYQCSYQSATNRRPPERSKFLSRMAPLHPGALLVGQIVNLRRID